MATYTSNYNLKKPEQNDFYNVEDFNGNMDIVDSKLKEVSQKADGALPESSYTANDILNKLKTVDGNGSGLDADLFKGQSVIPIANGGTGKNNLNDFISNKNTAPAGKLSDIKTSGIYLAYPSSNYIDYPDNGGNYGVLVVVQSSNYVYQTFYGVYTNTGNLAVNYRLLKTNDETIVGWVENVNSINLPNMINKVLQTGGVSVVKSIQRGFLAYSAAGVSTGVPKGDKTDSVSISTVNPAKCFTILDFDSGSAVISPYVSNISSNKLTIIRPDVGNSNNVVHPQCSWQVIEYY